MNNDLIQAARHLATGQVQSIEDARGLRVFCLSGHLWLTQEGDPRDVVLGAGDEARIERDGLSVLSALSDASFVLTRERTLPDARLLARQAHAALAAY